MNCLTSELEKRAQSSFTGNIVLQDRKNGQFMGQVLLEKGLITDIQRQKGLRGYRALLAYAMEAQEKDCLIIAEPSLPSGKNPLFKNNRKAIKKVEMAIKYYYKEIKDLKPCRHLKLAVKKKILPDEKNLLPWENDLLSHLSQYERVGELYEKSNLLDFEITIGLVKLRKKGLIKVVSS